ncbi:hypothetical cytosolic protein [Syntrophus aciditrophicus SB]|uniref:Hypothetical cytosolic protein n=1 Tax=Syntrophus aciditrophicus (strain SB) TaxID=56780 RepID=Q2LTN1_SYNAS|nr:hypothetical cytosolic protein [Syntrophus aciditrophicus SB]
MLKKKHRAVAHCHRTQWAQVLQEVEEHEEHSDEEAPPNVPPKTDISFSTWSELQSGQRTSRFSEIEKNRTSKTFLHCLHRNS